MQMQISADHKKNLNLLRYYLWSNTWEFGVAIAFSISSVGSIITRNNETNLSKIWGEPWDTLLLFVSAIAGLSVLIGLLAWIPKVRAAGLVMLATVLIILAVSAVHISGIHRASFGATAYLGLAAAAITRAIGVVVQGDYPPRRRNNDYPRRGC